MKAIEVVKELESQINKLTTGDVKVSQIRGQKGFAKVTFINFYQNDAKIKKVFDRYGIETNKIEYDSKKKLHFISFKLPLID